MSQESRGEFLRRIGFPFGAAVATASLFVSALTLPAWVRGDEPKPEAASARPAKSKSEIQAEKRKKQAARQERIKKKMEREKAKDGQSKDEAVSLPPRPARTITPPTLTPAELDSLVKTHLAANDPKVVPAPLTSDVEFVRRIYLDLMGHPPTASQVTSFVRDTSKEKRARLIDRLLASPEFSTNWARYWRDVIKFHATNPNAGQIRYPELEAWLTEKLKKDAPWDEIASELITATGRNDENGAVGMSLAHLSQPVELAGEVSRIFMGVQIQCAQCHDHKTDSWKQQQFHEFAAFFAGGRQRNVEKAAKGKPAVFGVFVQGKPRYTYTKVDDPKTQIPVAPKFFLASTAARPAPVAASASGSSSASRPVTDESLPMTLDAAARRKLAASYITGQDNPWFARAFVNRTWYALMGEAFYTPIDDIGPERDVKALEVLEPLATQWQKGGYDIRWLFRTILNTESYQRRVRSTANEAGKTAFASNCPSRLRSDQIFGALVQALGFPAEAGDNPELLAARMARRAGEKGKDAGGAPALEGLGEAANKPAGEKDGEMKAGTDMPIRKASAKKVADATGLASQAAKGARRLGITPLNLFNNLFGVDPSEANEDVLGTIPQALFMMNSPMIAQRTQVRPGTVLGEILKSAPSDRAALGALYLRVLSRQPTPKEVETCSQHLAAVGDRAEAFEDIYWCLINSTEFITRR